MSELHQYLIVDKRVESHDVVTLYIRLVDKRHITYVPGQFITVYMPGAEMVQGKAYSISSAPHEKYLAITVKAIGEFSNYLCSLNIGDHVAASLPYGYFYSESNDSALMLVAAGIGVAPFRSIILEELHKNPARQITLSYSNRTLEDIIFKKEFDKLASKHKNFKVHYFITRQEKIPEGLFSGRIIPRNIITSTQHIPDREFLLCGSIPFTRDMWKGFKELKVPEERLYTEAFFSH